MKYLYLYFCPFSIFFIVSGCNLSNNYILDLPKFYIDSLPQVYKNKNYRTPQYSEMYPMYIGNNMDTINLNTSSEFINNYRTLDPVKYSFPKQSELTIYVDTTKTIGIIKWHSIPYPISEKHLEKEFVPCILKSYPVIISNTTNDTLAIGFGKFLDLYLEAKNKDGQWNPIQKIFGYSCGTGVTTFFLPQNNIAVTACPIQLGSFKTKLRVRYYRYRNTSEIVSNEFEGIINPEIFTLVK